MSTEVLKVDPASVDAQVIARAVEVVRSGGLVGFPTETVYGAAVRADNAAAVDRLRSAKARSASRAFTVHIASTADAFRFAPDVPGVARRMMRRGWPGPLTLIVDVETPSAAPAMAELAPSTVDAVYHQGTVGLRCPSDPIARELLIGIDAPVIAASANAVGAPPPMSASDVLASFADQIDLLIDGGPTRYANASTIVRVSDNGFGLIREGVYDAGIVGRFAEMHILLVCTGNTCRSPMAAAIARKLLANRLGCSLDELQNRGIFVTSAGTAGGGGGGAAAHAVEVMAKEGLDLSTHVSTGITEEMVRAADHIFSMTASHQAAVLRIDRSAVDRATLVLGDRDVADPIGGDYDDYDRCATEIEAGLRDRIEEISI